MSKTPKITRPLPPIDVVDAIGPMFVPAPEVDEWLRAAFLDEKSSLYNVEHDHLNSANLGTLWTNVENTRQTRRVVGMVELPKPHPALGKWAKARYEAQMWQWFGDPEQLDFLITLDAVYCAGVSDVEFCSIVEHELYHCAQKMEDNIPAFNKRTGKPKFALRGHDVEEFVGIIRRYGVSAAAGDTAALVAAAQLKPEIAEVQVASMCGNCIR
jgi:hypothetical protein